MVEKNPNDPTGAVERIYKAWDAALGTKDLDAVLALYAPDATIESPLVAHLLGVESGICQGHDELRRFIHLVFQRQPAARKRFGTCARRQPAGRSVLAGRHYRGGSCETDRVRGRRQAARVSA